MPKEVFTLDDLYRRDMMDVGEVHESTTGRKEGGQESGRHAAIRVEGDTRSTAVTRELLTEGLAQAGAQTLWLYWQYVKEPRNIHLVGHDFEVDLRDFTGEDLFNQQELGRQPGPQDFNVSVELGRDDQRDENLMMIQVMTELGYWSPATHGHYVERLIGEGLSTEHDKYGWERRNAADEHRRFARGEEVRTALGDDDNIHLEEHYRWTTTAEYRRAEKRDKDLAAALEVHLREHMFNDAQKRHTREMIDALAKEQVQGELRDEAVGAAAPAGTETIPVGPEGVPPGAEALPAGAGGPAPAIPPELIAAAQAGAGGAPM